MINRSSAADRRTKDVGVRRHRVGSPDAPREVVRAHSISRVGCVAQRFLCRGTVVLAEIPYADGTGRKWRPAVVVEVSGHVVTLLPCTTSRAARQDTDVAIVDLDVAGLHKHTVVRTGRSVAVDRTVVAQVYGHLSLSDADRLIPNLRESA